MSIFLLQLFIFLNGFSIVFIVNLQSLTHNHRTQSCVSSWIFVHFSRSTLLKIFFSISSFSRLSDRLYSHLITAASLSPMIHEMIIHRADRFSLVQIFFSTTNTSACMASGLGRFLGTSLAPSAWIDRAYRLSLAPEQRPAWASIRYRRPRRAHSPPSSSCTCDSGTRSSPEWVLDGWWRPGVRVRARSGNAADGSVAPARRSAPWRTGPVVFASCARSRGAAPSRFRPAVRLRSPATPRPWTTRDCSPAATGTTCPRSPGSSSPVVGEHSPLPPRVEIMLLVVLVQLASLIIQAGVAATYPYSD